MDSLDSRLLDALRRNARLPVSALALELGVTRATVRKRLTRLEERDILGYTIRTRAEARPAPVRGLMMLEIEGRGATRVEARLMGLPQVAELHRTNGAWDLVVGITTQTLEELDETLTTIRRIDGVKRSETNLLLSTRRG